METTCITFSREVKGIFSLTLDAPHEQKGVFVSSTGYICDFFGTAIDVMCNSEVVASDMSYIKPVSRYEHLSTLLDNDILFVDRAGCQNVLMLHSVCEFCVFKIFKFVHFYYGFVC